jgi:hypothetical protein
MRSHVPQPRMPGHTTSARSTISGWPHFRHGNHVNPILRLQATIGNQGVQRALAANTMNVEGDTTTNNPSRALDVLNQAGADGGRAPPLALRSRIEVATHVDLSGVRIHTGSNSQQAARMLNARAFTIGGDIHFGQGQYRPGNEEADRLIAHEIVHTIQQGAGANGVMPTTLEVSEPGDAAEVEADTIADAITGSRATAPGPTPLRVSAARKAISRVEFKNGDATFKVDPYAEVDSDNGKDTARQVGAEIEITYKSAETYKSDKIGFIQTMKTTKDDAPYLFENEKPRATESKAGEAGWAIDRLKDMKSPIYAQENTGSAGGNTKFGNRKSKTDFKDAWMHDKIGLNRAVGQKVAVNAVTFAFDETNSKYLGGISWGFATDAKGTTKKKVAALQSAGDPGGIQKEALKKWNEQAGLADVSKRNAPDQKKVVVP